MSLDLNHELFLASQRAKDAMDDAKRQADETMAAWEAANPFTFHGFASLPAWEAANGPDDAEAAALSAAWRARADAWRELDDAQAKVVRAAADAYWQAEDAVRRLVNDYNAEQAETTPAPEPVPAPAKKGGFWRGLGEFMSDLADAQDARLGTASGGRPRPSSSGSGGLSSGLGMAAVGAAALGGLAPPSRSTSYEAVSWDDRVVGDGGGCVIYQRADGRYYGLDRDGRKAENSGNRVSGPATYDPRDKVIGAKPQPTQGPIDWKLYS